MNLRGHIGAIEPKQFWGWGAQIEGKKNNAQSAQIVAQREQQQLLSNKEIVASEQITAAL